MESFLLLLNTTEVNLLSLSRTIEACAFQNEIGEFFSEIRKVEMNETAFRERSLGYLASSFIKWILRGIRGTGGKAVPPSTPAERLPTRTPALRTSGTSSACAPHSCQTGLLHEIWFCASLRHGRVFGSLWLMIMNREPRRRGKGEVGSVVTGEREHCCTTTRGCPRM